jgi:hypothetical protein
MIKKVTFQVETEATNERIISGLTEWLMDNFRVNKYPEIKIEDVE